MRVEYLDAARPADQDRARALLERVSGGQEPAKAAPLFYPMVFVDSTLTMAGSAEYYEVLYAVREALSEQQG